VASSQCRPHRWEEIDAKAITTILIKITPNMQAGLDCSSAKTAWDRLLSQYAQADPIAQNLAHACLHANCFTEGSTETLPAHIAELQRLREVCMGLGVSIMGSQFTGSQFMGILMLSMPTPSWDPVVSTLGGLLDPKVIISRLNTEWSRRQGPTSADKDTNHVFQIRTKPKCKNCSCMGHTATKCWAKGGAQEGQYPDWYKGKKDSCTSVMVKPVTDTPIVWSHGYASQPDIWFADCAATVHISPNQEDFTSYQKYDKCQDIKAFGQNTMKGIGKGDILADISF